MYIHRDKETWRGSDSDINKRYTQTVLKAGKLRGMVAHLVAL